MGIRQADSKGRITLGSEYAGTTFTEERQPGGAIILRPAVTVPVDEAWLFKNKEALRLVDEGLQQAREGKLRKVNLKSDKALVAKMNDEK